MDNKEIIAVASTHGIGCTFLDWSMLFLNGRDTFFNVQKNCVVPVVNDPLTGINAHRHEKNHPLGYNQTKQCITNFLKTDHTSLNIYIAPLLHDWASDALGITEDQLVHKSVNQIVEYHQMSDFADACELIMNNGQKLVYIDHNLPLFNIETRQLDRLFREYKKPNSPEEFYNSIQNVFFPHSIKKWTEMGLTDIWDVRERMALDTRPLDGFIKPRIKFSKSHCLIDSQEWFSWGEEVIKTIMSFCNKRIEPDRFDQWLPIYQRWKYTNYQRLSFCYRLPHIVDSIVNGNYHKIDLTFNQEVVVQHCLIYQHNLNLKTWQLEKFPDNTQELHKLLEPNIHPIHRDV